MKILCGTDFSAGAREALRVAATLAAREHETLLLVHTIDAPALAPLDSDLRARARSAAMERLSAEAEAARALGATVVEERIDEGSAPASLASADVDDIGLTVLGFVGARQGSAEIGGTAERVVASAKSPVLVVRDAAVIEDWLRGKHKLRIVVGDDLTAASEPALRWAAGLGRLDPCEFVACHVFWLIGEKSRLGVGGSVYTRVPQLEQANLAALRRHAAPILGNDAARFRVEATLGRPAEPLVAMAVEENADLVVVGTRQRAGLDRVWHGSTSHIVLSKARINVACVPARESAPVEPGAVASFRRVLVTTDLSPLGDRAIPHAFAIAADGGTVHVLYVDESDPPEAPTSAIERLRKRIPAQLAGKTVKTEIEVVNDANVSAAIAAAAERLDVDVVCMTTHGRSGLSRVVLGSVAQEVAERCRRQVLLVPPLRSEP